jgi:hypothetical protein
MRRYHREHGVKHVMNRQWVDGEIVSETIVPNRYEYNPPQKPEGDDRLVDFSLFAGGEIGLGLYEAVIQSPRRSGPDHLTAIERMTIEDTVVRDGILFRAIPDVTSGVPWFLEAGSLRKAFPGCPDLERLQRNLKIVGCPTLQTFEALVKAGWNRVSQLAYALTYEIAESGPKDQPVCIVDDNRLFGEPEEDDEATAENPAEINAPPMFMRYVRVSHHEENTAHDKGIPNPAWFEPYKTVKTFEAKSLGDLRLKQKSFRRWYEGRKERRGFSSVAKAFWNRYYEEYARLASNAMSDQVVTWISRIMTVPEDKLKLAGAHIGTAIREGRFTADQGALLWKAWHRRKK